MGAHDGRARHGNTTSDHPTEAHQMTPSAGVGSARTLLIAYMHLLWACLWLADTGDDAYMFRSPRDLLSSTILKAVYCILS